jgi:hypothetical protein
MQGRGFTKRQAEEIDEWSRHDKRLTSACEALEVLQHDLRLATTMTRAERREALKTAQRRSAG